MSPSKERKKRRFFAVAALTANGMGAGAGLATQALISDPMTSVLVGTVVSGTVGDILLQVARARADKPGLHAGAGHERADELGCHDRRVLGANHRHPGHPRQWYTRCTRLTRREEGPAVPRQTPHTDTGVPQHPRHRHLHRAAQRRVQAKHMGAIPDRGGNASS
ncbi:hypothetical protein [Streptomyces prasinus]|uniref:hypothetical protein n=1 Tax=Streptomyces prasinus TaxID=67345 RepID=UPI0006E1F1D1|nr:hypothetical protein [Streptomyces prasinus]